MEIFEHQTLELHNVLSFRGKMMQQELQFKSQEFESVMKEAGVNKAAPAVTSTFSVE